MAIDFPDSPAVNDTFTVGDRTWQWNGTYWSFVASIPSGVIATTDYVDSSLVPATFDSVNNRVGINTTSPAAELDVSAAVSPDIRLTSEKDGTWTDGESMGSLSFYSSDASDGGAGVRGRVATVAGDTFGYTSELALSVSGDSGLFEVVRIDHDGNVGIGTTTPNPSFSLHVEGDIRVGVGSSATIGFYDDLSTSTKSLSWDTSVNDWRVTDGGGTTRTLWHSGNLGVPTSYTPSFSSGVTVGNGTFDAAYIRVNDLIVAYGDFTLGSTSAVTGEIVMEPPVQAADTYGLAIGTTVQFRDASIALHFLGAGSPLSTSTVRLRHLNNATPGRLDGCNATTPFTWTTNDRIVWNMVYEAA